MAGIIGGTVYLRIGARNLPLGDGSFTYSVDKNTRESVVGRDQRHHGFVENPKASFIAGELVMNGSFKSADIKAFQGTVTLECRNGITVVLNEAMMVGDFDPDPTTAKVSVRFEGEGMEI